MTKVTTTTNANLRSVGAIPQGTGTSGQGQAAVPTSPYGKCNFPSLRIAPLNAGWYKS